MKEVPRLEEWVTFPEAAKFLGLTKQALYRRVEMGTIAQKDVRVVGSDSNPLYLLRITATAEMRIDLDQRAAVRLEREQKNSDHTVVATSSL